MRLRRLDLARYGKFTDQTIDFGDRIANRPDLHLVYGPNEAGKSTAFAGFLDLLFGIETHSKYGFLHPYPAMRIGACLELSAGARELVRVKRPQPTLRDSDNQPVAEGLILSELGGLDRNAYRTMFSLDDDTLEAGGKSILASNGELGQLLFSASAGLSDFSKALIDLRSEMDGFYKLNARSGDLRQLKAELAAFKEERDQIDTLASEYNRLATLRDSAAAQYEAALGERSQAQTSLISVQRRLSVQPRMAALRRILEDLKGFDDIPRAPPGWSAELPGLQQAESANRTKIELAAAEVKRLSDELAAIVVDATGVRLASSLDRLTERRARYLTAELDLPTRRRELVRAEGLVSDILKRLGCETEGKPARLLLTAVQMAALLSLIETRSGVSTSVITANEERSEALQLLADARSALQAVGVSPDTVSAAHNRLAPLITALGVFRDSDHTVRLRNATRLQAKHSASLIEQLEGLTPWTGTAETLSGLQVPDPVIVKAWETAAERAEALVERRKDNVERLEAELVQRNAELAAADKIAGLVSDREAAAIRSQREAAWAEHRRVLDPISAGTFEDALRRDDAVAVARLGHERDLARLHETAQVVAVKQAEAEHACAMLAAANAEQQRHHEAIAASVVTIDATLSADMVPAQLLGWLARRDKALEVQSLLKQSERDRREAEAAAADVRTRLQQALELAAVPFASGASAEALAATAQSAVEGEAHLQQLRLEVTERERELRKRDAALQKATLAESEWQAGWHGACSACWLGEKGTALSVEAVREVLTATTELRSALEAHASIADRIRDMEDDQATFEEELGQLLTEIGVDPGHGSQLDLAQIVDDRVKEACRAQEASACTCNNLVVAEENHRLVSADASIQATRINEMTSFYHVGSLFEVAGRLRDAQQKANLGRQAENAEREILSALHVETLTEAEAMLQLATEQKLELEQAELTVRLEDFDKRTRELFAVSRQAADNIEAVGGDDAAARIEERRRTKLLEIEERSLSYLRLRAGIVAADRALRTYRDQHRSSMMTLASEAFRIISRGAYQSLSTQPEKEGDVLIVVGEDGGSKMAADLSKGTRFQLYLALRAAGYQEYAKLRPPVPFIADDITETFDDFRAEEAFRLFGEMAKVGQVIYLTHHDHLCAIAERINPDVQIHRLAANGRK